MLIGIDSKWHEQCVADKATVTQSLGGEGTPTKKIWNDCEGTATSVWCFTRGVRGWVQFRSELHEQD